MVNWVYSSIITNIKAATRTCIAPITHRPWMSAAAVHEVTIGRGFGRSHIWKESVFEQQKKWISIDGGEIWPEVAREGGFQLETEIVGCKDFMVCRGLGKMNSTSRPGSDGEWQPVVQVGGAALFRIRPLSSRLRQALVSRRCKGWQGCKGCLASKYQRSF